MSVFFWFTVCYNLCNLCEVLVSSILMEVLSLLPRLCDILRSPSAVDHRHVSCADFRCTYCHEVWPWTPNSVLCKVSKWLADSSSKQKGAYYLVECSYILIELCVRLNPLSVDQISLSRWDLRRENKKNQRLFLGFFPPHFSSIT